MSAGEWIAVLFFVNAALHVPPLVALYRAYRRIP